MLDKLESIGALQRSNRMELEEFLDPPDEAHAFDIGTVTDQDIFDAVMEAKREEEEGDDIDTDTLAEPTPTPAEAIQAALTLIRDVKDKDGAYFRELESMLALFVQRVRTNDTEDMVDTEP